MHDLLTLLLSTGLEFAAWGWAKAPAGDYGVVTLNTPETLGADSRNAETVERYYVDYFTRSSGETARAAIEAKLKTMKASEWRLNSVQFEEETDFVHFEWVVVRFGQNEL